VDPTITAACIGGAAAIVSGGWTALVAVMTSRNARQTNQATLNAAAENTARALDAARDDRLWDKRAEAYVDALYVIRHRQERRKDAIRAMRFQVDQETENHREEWLASINPPDEVGMEMRLLAYATEPVLDAARATGEASVNVENAYQAWALLRDQRQSGGPGALSGGNLSEANQAVQAALAKSDAADEALLSAIRADLLLRPSQVRAVPSVGTERSRPMT
jgi:hypothetical protein